MGFEIFEESDITSELYGFDNLNFPNHPARESMDTYWLEGHDKGQSWGKAVPAAPSDRRLRPYADPQAPLPLRVPRPVYRNETTDARHERAPFSSMRP